MTRSKFSHKIILKKIQLHNIHNLVTILVVFCCNGLTIIEHSFHIYENPLFYSVLLDKYLTFYPSFEIHRSWFWKCLKLNDVIIWQFLPLKSISSNFWDSINSYLLTFITWVMQLIQIIWSFYLFYCLYYGGHSRQQP